MKPKTSCISVTDQFCGAGGSSLGATALGLEVKLALNHWKLAVETHATNFPGTEHVLADMSAVDPRRYPSTDILLSSPECTSHSLSKGKPRKNIAQLDLWGNHRIDPAEERSRATFWDIPRFAEVHNYNLIVVENVVDARYWVLFDAWLNAMHVLGYEHQIVYFNSQFARPTPQSRDRMYIVFWKRGNHAPNLDIRPKAFCSQCGRDVEAIQLWKHGKKWGKYKAQYVYACPKGHGEVRPHFTPAWTVIDWHDKGGRIGDRVKPLSENTTQRIQKGLNKFGNQAILVRHYTPGTSAPVTEPTGTVTTQDHHSLVVPGSFLVGYYTRDNAHSDVNEPVPTVTTEKRHAIVMPFLTSYYGTGGEHAIVEPVPTVTTKERHALVQPTTPRLEDCLYRMLTPAEVGGAMAFPKSYVVVGNKSQQIKQFGNALNPPVMTMLLERCVESLQ